MTSDSLTFHADVSKLGVVGFGATTQIISALTADNVAPVALDQMERLGSLFLSNGDLAKEMPDLLRQSSSYLMERFGFMVGYRKFDTASRFGETAGGQSIALLIACLRNLKSNDEVGEICYTLCLKMLSQDLNIVSVHFYIMSRLR